MFLIRQYINLILVAISALLVVTFGGCTPYNQNPYVVKIPTHVSPDEAQSAAVRVLQQRNWHVESQSPDEVVGTLDHRDWKAKTMLQIGDQKIIILNDSLWREGRDGPATDPGVPRGWLRNLQSDLNRAFGNKVESY